MAPEVDEDGRLGLNQGMMTVSCDLLRLLRYAHVRAWIEARAQESRMGAGGFVGSASVRIEDEEHPRVC